MNSVKNFEEIILVDSGSTDKTVEIARDFGVNIYMQDWLGFAKQKQFALEKCTMPWVLNLDADEAISDAGKEEIIKLINTNMHDAIEFKMYNYFCGKRPHPLSQAMKKVRFSRCLNVKYDTDRAVHESMIVDGKILKSPHAIYHFGESSIHTLVHKINEYSTIKHKHNIKSFLIIPISISIFILMFAKSYILQRNFLNCNRGFVASFIIAFYGFLKYTKQIENKNDNL